MEYRKENVNRRITQGNLYDRRERERILMQYGGIFKNNIKEYATKVIPKLKSRKNFAR